MKTTHHLLIEVESDVEVDFDALEQHCLEALRNAAGNATSLRVGGLVKFNTVVYETSYPTPNPEEI